MVVCQNPVSAPYVVDGIEAGATTEVEQRASCREMLRNEFNERLTRQNVGWMKGHLRIVLCRHPIVVGSVALEVRNGRTAHQLRRSFESRERTMEQCTEFRHLPSAIS